MLKVTLRLLFVIAVISCGPALADLSPDPVGAPEEIGSWVMPFLYQNGAAFDQFDVRMLTSGIRFVAGSAEQYQGFAFPRSNTTWHDTSGDNWYSASARTSTDVPVNLLLFSLYFSSHMSQPLAFRFDVYSSGKLIQWGEADWNPGCNCGQWAISHHTAVSEPSSLVLRWSWLVGLGLLLIRRVRTVTLAA